ncbi:OLC1v1008778C1 [Oldenlandia corymbosa var. corymbosa]|uniref:OLC1v1008778C1 n=1 Tax=Oldenlandia corymbosa var. corymbosa TaxID=529605 RepID=A0AAV1DMJ1_OLDCO|nr:OLC1v1008778C1 [Oldenlandia corymbosa var. corymbosa]
MEINQLQMKKPRILCLHGYGDSGKILEKTLGKWPEFVLEKMDLVYIDAPFAADPSSFIERFDSPHYMWFQAFHHDHDQFNKSFDEAISYIEEQMIKLGPFDGVLGVSQGGSVTSTLPGMQKQGVALTKVPKIKFVIIISGAKLGGLLFPSSPQLAKNAFSTPIDIPSLHIVGEKDELVLPQYQFELMESFVRPTLLYHHGGHGVPDPLDDNGVKTEGGDQSQESSSSEFELTTLPQFLRFKVRIPSRGRI